MGFAEHFGHSILLFSIKLLPNFVLLEALVAKIVADMTSLGYQKVVFRYDGSTALESLINVVKMRWGGDSELRTIVL